MQHTIYNRYSGEAQFTAEIDCDEDASDAVKHGLAVLWAIRNEADLGGADLGGAYLRGASLRGADLNKADLGGADLRGAHLCGANLYGADLRGADLRGADFRGADLCGANLRGAKWHCDIILERAPLCLTGLDYDVTILDQRMQIGCELHTLAEWAAFDNERIAKMDGKRARKFWDAHGKALLALAASDGRGVKSDD